MCSVLAGITALTGVMQYQAQQEQADAQARAYERQAEVAEHNAKIENRKQEQVADNAARETEELRQRQRIIAGQTRAQAGAAGLDMAGSPLDILSAGYDAYNQDKQTSLMNQRNRNYDLRVSESNYLNEAANQRAAAANTRSLARSQGLATILGTAASIYGNVGGGGGSASSAATGSGVPSSVTSNVGTNTTATWSSGAGYSFAPAKTLGNWGYSLAPKKTYFPSR